MKPKRLWKNLKVKKISILTDDWNPANGEIALFKSQGNLVNLCKVDKQDAEEGLLYVTVAKIAPDSDGDAPESLKELKKAAHDFTKAGNMGCVDHNHDMKDMAGCEIVQSYVDEASGEWKAVIDINGNETMMQKARDGQISGVSFFGPAEVSPVLEKSEKGLFEGFLNWIKGGSNLQKGFKENIATADWWRVSDAFTSAVRKILEDETITDKAAAIDEQVQDFSSYVKNQAGIIDKINLKKGEVEMKIEDLDKHLAEKYGFKPLEQKKEDDKPAGDTAPDATAELEKANKRIEQLEKSVETLSKGRNTNGDLGGGAPVTMVDLLKSADALEEFQAKYPERFAAMKQEWLNQ